MSMKKRRDEYHEGKYPEYCYSPKSDVNKLVALTLKEKEHVQTRQEPSKKS